MSVAVKICGLKTPDAVSTSVTCGAVAVGFVHFAPSPRHVAPQTAAALATEVPRSVIRVAVLVDPDDALVDAAAAYAQVLQLHGGEDPKRVAEVRARTGCAVWKGVGVATATDVARAVASHAEVADRLLLDARPPQGAPLPGGNGLAFDPAILAGIALPPGWILSGGLESGMVAAAVRGTGATMVDVSSGVESSPGVKSLEKIAGFLEAAARA
ncbi:MAG: phosphoribosylanthranilate isomerase [Thermaurantiacus sp.]